MEKKKEDVESEGQSSKDGSTHQETIASLIMNDLTERKQGVLGFQALDTVLKTNEHNLLSGRKNNVKVLQNLLTEVMQTSFPY